MADETRRAVDLFGGAVALVPGGVTVRDPSKLRSPATDRLVWQAVFGGGEEREAARWLLWELGQVTGARPASINGLYWRAAGATSSGFTVPAINVRMMAYDTARAIFRAARAGTGGRHHSRDRALGDRLHRAASRGVRVGADRVPRCARDTCCRSSSRATIARSTRRSTQADPEGEVGEVKKLIAEEVGAGFYNIDVDTSTLVDLDQPTLDAQQRLNFERAADITALHPRARARGRGRLGRGRDRRGGDEEQHRGGAARLHAGLQPHARRRLGTHEGISKISVQTGTSHGGVVLADGSIADVKLDLQALAALSQVARETYGLAGAVQHGASTLPSSAFGNFPRIETAEIHLATNFQNIVFDHRKLPADLRDRVRGWLDENAASERKAGDTNEQFNYKARKKAIGPFKREFWSLPEDVRGAIAADLERTFVFLFDQLNVNGTEKDINRFVQAPMQHHAALRPALVSAADDPDAGE